MDASTVQAFVGSVQSPGILPNLPVRRCRVRIVFYGAALLGLYWIQWQQHAPPSPCVSAVLWVVVGGRRVDVPTVVLLVGSVPLSLAWPALSVVPTWASALSAMCACVWLVVSVAVPPSIQCAVFAIVGYERHPGWLLAGLMARRCPTWLPALSLATAPLVPS